MLPLVLMLLAQDWQAVSEWKPTPFRGAGKVAVERNELSLEPGAPMTGLTAAWFAPRMDYEIRFEAMRLRGNDFFASLTFPYGDSHATWVNGGWGGDIVGISSIDNWDASENETRTYVKFEDNRYYRFHLKVTRERITATIDGKIVVELNVNGRAISLRRGMDVTTPLSLFCYNTASRMRNVEYRKLPSRSASSSDGIRAADSRSLPASSSPAR